MYGINFSNEFENFLKRVEDGSIDVSLIEHKITSEVMTQEFMLKDKDNNFTATVKHILNRNRNLEFRDRYYVSEDLSFLSRRDIKRLYYEVCEKYNKDVVSKKSKAFANFLKVYGDNHD